jgi:hypothetical protein
MKKPLINTTTQNEEFRIAILNNDLDCFENLCRKEYRSSQIREYGYPRYRLSLEKESFCTIAVACWVSVERFEFILKVSKERPSQYVFDLAVEYCLWDIVSYLHDYGFRHKTIGHFFDNLISERRRSSVEIALYYPEFWDNSSKYIDEIIDIIDVARHRRSRALNASVAILSLKKKRPNLIHKDVLQIIAKTIMQKDNVAKEKWGEPRFFNRLPLRTRNNKEWVFVCTVLCILFFSVHYFLIWLAKK